MWVLPGILPSAGQVTQLRRSAPASMFDGPAFTQLMQDVCCQKPCVPQTSGLTSRFVVGVDNPRMPCAAHATREEALANWLAKDQAEELLLSFKAAS